MNDYQRQVDGRAVGTGRGSSSEAKSEAGWSWSSLEEQSRSSQWNYLDSTQWCSVERSAERIPLVSDMPPKVSAMGRRWNFAKDP